MRRSSHSRRDVPTIQWWRCVTRPSRSLMKQQHSHPIASDLPNLWDCTGFCKTQKWPLNWRWNEYLSCAAVYFSLVPWCWSCNMLKTRCEKSRYVVSLDVYSHNVGLEYLDHSFYNFPLQYTEVAPTPHLHQKGPRGGLQVLTRDAQKRQWELWRQELAIQNSKHLTQLPWHNVDRMKP